MMIKKIDEKVFLNPTFTAEQFSYKIFPKDYAVLSEAVIQKPELFRRLKDYRKELLSFRHEEKAYAKLSPTINTLSENLLRYNKKRFLEDGFINAALVLIKEIENYKQFYKELGASLKFNPISNNPSAIHSFIRIIELLNKYSVLIEPSILFQKIEASVDTEGLKILNTGYFFNSKHLVSYFSSNENSSQFIIYVVTIGPKLDDIVKKLMSEGEMYDAYLLNGIGAAAAEMVAFDLNLYFNDNYGTNGDLRFKRFSPGYGDWLIDDQKKIFSLLKPEKFINVVLTDSNIMLPEKSTSGIMGISSKNYL